MYEYTAKIVSVYDGDTVTVDIDLGMGVWLHGQKIRLFGINAPELRGSEKVKGREARDFLRSHIPNGSMVILRTIKDAKGKYGRYLGRIITEDGVDINTLMVMRGHAKQYMI